MESSESLGYCATAERTSSHWSQGDSERHVVPTFLVGQLFATFQRTGNQRPFKLREKARRGGDGSRGTYSITSQCDTQTHTHPRTYTHKHTQTHKHTRIQGYHHGLGERGSPDGLLANGMVPHLGDEARNEVIGTIPIVAISRGVHIYTCAYTHAYTQTHNTSKRRESKSRRCSSAKSSNLTRNRKHFLRLYPLGWQVRAAVEREVFSYVVVNGRVLRLGGRWGVTVRSTWDCGSRF